jgi:hormone-sensitive lipase
LNNPQLVGWTGENIVLVGDSAGGNLITACVIKCIELGIRKPTGIINFYAVFLADYVATPSRYFGLMDGILSYWTNTHIFRYYNGHGNLNKATVTKNFEIPKAEIDPQTLEMPKSHLLSPYRATDTILQEFPSTIIISGNFDPCLDECVEFAKKLKKNSVDVQLNILENLNHGFLNLSQVSLNKFTEETYLNESN